MAARHWVGGTASWDGTAGTKWSLTNGGAGGQAVPTSADDVFFDSGSGAAVVTIASGNTGAKSVDCTGYTGTLAGSTAISISGSVTLVAGMTFTNTSTWTIIGTGSLTSGGKTFNFVTINGSGITVTPVDAFNGGLILTQGTWAADTNNPSHTMTSFSSTAGNTRTLSMGSGLWTLTAAGTVWNFANTGNLTFNKNTASIKITDTSVTAKAFAGAGLAFNDVWFSGKGGALTFTGANTFADLRIDGGANVTINFPASTTTTVTSLTINGASGGAQLLMSSIPGTQATISDASGTDTLTWCAIRDIAFTGGATFAATSSYDMGNNSGITITGPGGGAGMLFIPNLEAT